MNEINELISNCNVLNFKILSIQKVSESENIVLLKTDQKSNFYIDILDFENNKINEVILDQEISKINDFHSIDENHFYVHGDYNGNSNYHLKINKSGEVLLKKQFDTEIYSSNHKHILKNFIFREDLILLDLESFNEYNLYEFLSDVENNFTYLYFSEGRYEIFTSRDHNILGFEIFDKDGDNPRCSYIILKIDNFENIKIKFTGKIEDAGDNYVFSENCNELLYSSRFHNNNTIIRQLTSNNFQNIEEHKKIKSSKIAYFGENKFISIKDFFLEIIERKTDNLLKTILIDKSSPFLIKNNFLFCVQNSKIVCYII